MTPRAAALAAGLAAALALAGCAGVKQAASEADRWLQQQLGAGETGPPPLAYAGGREPGPVAARRTGPSAPGAQQLRDGLAGLERGDGDRAAGLVLAAAEAGNADAQYLVGVTDELRPAGARDRAAASHWLARAALNGHPQAARALADRYAAGEGVPRDGALANLWYERAARRGDREAAYRLALRLLTGTGGREGRTDAYRWLAIAAAAGQPDAPRYRDALARQLTTVESRRLDDEARRWRAVASDPWPDPPVVRYRNQLRAAN